MDRKDLEELANAPDIGVWMQNYYSRMFETHRCEEPEEPHCEHIEQKMCHPLMFKCVDNAESVSKHFASHLPTKEAKQRKQAEIDKLERKECLCCIQIRKLDKNHLEDAEDIKAMREMSKRLGVPFINKRPPNREWDYQDISEWAKKQSISLHRFQKMQRYTDVVKLMRHCLPPEKDPSPSGKQFLPILILRRCNILIKTPPDYFHYDQVLEDLKLVESRWLTLLPKSQHHDLFYMKTLCEIKKKQFADAFVSLNMATKSLPYSNLKRNVKSIRSEKLKNGLEAIQEHAGNNEIFDQNQLPFDELKIKQKNKSFKSLSASVTIRKDGKSHGIVAKKEIQPGHVIGLEEPLLLAPFEDKDSDPSLRCHHCFKRSLCLLPCDKCSLVMFCSTKCMEAANNTYHDIECSIGLSDLIAEENWGVQRVVYPAVRYILSRPTSELQAVWGKKNIIDVPIKSTSDIKLDILLQTSRNGDNSMVEECFSLLPWKDKLFEVISKRKGIAESLLKKIMMTFIKEFDTYCTFINRPHEKNMKHATEVYLPLNLKADGFGYYPTISLAAHSCLPNAVMIVLPDNRCALMATGVIECGEKITVNQYISVLQEDFKFRNYYLGSFANQCSCLACKNGWGNKALWDMKKKVKYAFNEEILNGFINAAQPFHITHDFESLLLSRFQESQFMRDKMPWEHYMVWRSITQGILVHLLMIRYNVVCEWPQGTIEDHAKEQRQSGASE